MKLSNLMLIKSVVCIVFGVGLAFVPVPVMTLFAVALNPTGALMAQFLGAAFIVLAIYLFLARNATDPIANHAIAVAVFVGDAIGFVLALIGQLANLTNALGWIIVLLYLLLALGFGYFLLGKQATQMKPA